MHLSCFVRFFLFFFYIPRSAKNVQICKYKRTAMYLIGCLICADSSHAYLESACQFLITLQKTNSNNVFRGQILKYSYFARCTQSTQALHPLFGGQATLGVKKKKKKNAAARKNARLDFLFEVVLSLFKSASKGAPVTANQQRESAVKELSYLVPWLDIIKKKVSKSSLTRTNNVQPEHRHQ